MKIKAIKDTVLFTVAYFISNGLNAIAIPIFTRVLSKNEYGIWGTCSNLQLFSTNLFRLGCQQSVLKQFYDYTDKKERECYIISVLSFLALWSICIISLATLLIEIIGLNTIYEISIWPYLYLSVLISFLSSLYAVFESEIRLLGLSKRYFIFSLIIVGGNLALSLLLILQFDLGVIGKFVGTIVPYVIVVCFLIVTNRMKFKGIKLNYWIHAVKFGLPLGVNSLIFSIVWSYIYIRLNSVCDLDSIGEFHVGRNFGNMLPEYAFQAIVLSYQPFVYKALSEKRIADITRVNTYFITTLLLVSLVILIFANPIIVFLASDKYSGSTSIMQLLLIAFMVKILYYYPMLKTLSMNKSRECMYIQIFSLLVMWFFVELFISSEGMKVIPIAVILQESLSLICFLIISKCKIAELFNYKIFTIKSKIQ